MIVASSGLHANGASLARRIATTVPEGLQAQLASGATFGQALLAPAHIYVPLVARSLAAGIAITYLSHITGHGFLKIMRAQRTLTYRLTKVPPVPEVLQFMVDVTGMDMREAYRTFNMGAGFAVYCRPGSGSAVVSIASRVGECTRKSSDMWRLALGR